MAEESVDRPWSSTSPDEWRNAHNAARELRQKSTESEAVLWQALRAKRFHGLKFRRQHPLGRFVVDFYCDAARLAIEIDGSVHDGQAGHDEARQSMLELGGVRFVRIPAELVERDMRAALQMIADALHHRVDSGD